MMCSASARFLALFTLLFFFAVSPTRASLAPEFHVVVKPGCPETYIPKGQLTTGIQGASFADVTVPQLGELIDTFDHFIYRPGDDFWTAGTDSFTYTVNLNGGLGEITTATVFLNAGLSATRTQHEGFEQGWGAGWLGVDPSGSLSTSQAAALSGTRGLRASPPLDGFDAYLKRELVGGRGGGDTGSSTQSTIRIPGMGQRLPGGAMSKILTMGDPDSAAIHLWLREGASSYELGLDADGEKLWQPVAEGIHQVRLVWWEPGGGSRCGAGTALWLDGALHKLVPMPVGPPDENHELYVGRMAEPAVLPEPIDFDDVILQEFDGARQARQPLVLDGFEAITAAAGWTSVAPTAVLTTEAALVGKQGIEIVLGSGPTPDGALLWRGLSTPVQRLGARFRFDAVDLSLPHTGWVRLFSLHDIDATRLASLALRNEAGVLQLEAKVLEPGGSVRTILVPLGPETESQLTFDWQSAGAADSAPTGVLRVWRGDRLVIELTGLDNGGQTVAQMRFGAKRGTTLAAGVIHLDQFESWVW